MTPQSQFLSAHAGHLATTILRVLDAQGDPRTGALDVSPLRPTVEGFCRDAWRVGIRPTKIRHFVAALLDLALPPDVPTEWRRVAVRDAERLVDHAYFVHDFV